MKTKEQAIAEYVDLHMDKKYLEGFKNGIAEREKEILEIIEKLNIMEFKEVINKQLTFLNSSDPKEPKDLVLINLRDMIRDFLRIYKQELKSKINSLQETSKVEMSEIKKPTKALRLQTPERAVNVVMTATSMEERR